jgi:hypothetical protein
MANSGHQRKWRKLAENIGSGGNVEAKASAASGNQAGGGSKAMK